METDEKHDISKYLKVLRDANTDNEKFAALLMVAKTTKDELCNVDVKREILDAVGVKFFSRLLKTNNVPEDCPANIYKSVALSILSALCTQPQVARSPVLTDNVTSFNTIVLLNPGKDDGDRQLVDDAYDCFNSLCQTEVGLECLLKAKSISTLCQAFISQSYGFEKAHELICCVASCFGPDTWNGCEHSYHTYVNFLGRQFFEDETLHKFEMCKTLVFLLSAAPNDKEDTIEPPWIRPIVRGLYNILRSKIGASQREPALRLASVMVQVCGIYSIQPPYTDDFKLFLLTTHLCCVEVRMVLEDPDLSLATDKGRLLSSCYTFLENIINHLTSGATIDIEDRQVMQLHCAMVGAFGAVINFLKRVSIDTNVQWNSIILATVRVLAAWMAEETSALKEEIFHLIPFLVQISKMCILPDKIRRKAIDSSLIDSETNEYDKNKKNGERKETKSNKDLDSNENIKDSVEEIVLDESEDLNKKMNGVSVSDDITEVKPGPMETEDTDISTDIKMVDSCINSQSDEMESCLEKVNQDRDGNVEIIDTDRESLKSDDHLSDEQLENGRDKNVVAIVETTMSSDIDIKDKDLGESRMEKEVLNAAELQELHVKADILHFLLPALCHLTADEYPRHILLKCGGLGLLDLYMWRQWEKLVDQENLRETVSSLVILCNIFLNLVIVEQDLVPEHQEFSHILLLVTKGIHIIEMDPDYIVLWSHMTTLGLMLTRALHRDIDVFLEKDSVNRFFISSVRFLSGAYTAKHKKRQATLDIVDVYKMAWEQISQTWFLSMQAFANCVSMYPNLPSIVLKTGWLPGLLKILTDVKANSVAEETRSCFMLLLTAVAKMDKAAKSVIREKGGLDLARLFKSPELQEILQSA